MTNANEYERLDALSRNVNDYWSGRIAADKLAEVCLPEDYQIACRLLTIHAADITKSTLRSVDSTIAEAMREIGHEIRSAPGARYRQQLRVGLIGSGIETARDTRADLVQGARQKLERKVADFHVAMESRYNNM